MIFNYLKIIIWLGRGVYGNDVTMKTNVLDPLL